MNYTAAGPGRLLRRTDGIWAPVGPVMPPVEDDGLHDVELADGALVYFAFPLEVDAAPGDILLVREKAVRLMGRCGNHHPAVAALRAYMFAHYDAAFAAEWLSGRQVWSTRVLDDAARDKLSIRRP